MARKSSAAEKSGSGKGGTRRKGRPTRAATGLSGIMLPAMFEQPNFVAKSDWGEHLPFGFWLVAARRPSLIVELGTRDGVSFLAFCQAVAALGLEAQCRAVTVRQAGDDNEANAIAAGFGPYLDEHYASFASAIDGIEAGLAATADGSVDILNINTAHVASMTLEGLKAWLPKLSKRGVLMLHDMGRPAIGNAVADLYEMLRATHASFELPHGQGLAVIAIGSDLTGPLGELFAASRSKAASKPVQELFARLGRSLTVPERPDWPGSMADDTVLARREEALEEALLVIKALRERAAVTLETQRALAESREELIVLRRLVSQSEEGTEHLPSDNGEKGGDQRGRLAYLESALEQKRHEAEQTSVELTIARQKLRLTASIQDEREALLASYKAHLAELTDDRADRRAETQTLADRNRDLAADRDRANSALAEAEMRYAALERELEELAARYHELEDELALAAGGGAGDAGTNRTSEESARLSAEYETLEARIRDYGDKVVKLTRLIADKDHEIRRGADALAKLEQKMAKSAGPLSREADAARFAEERSERVRQAAARQLGDAVASLLNTRRLPFEPQALRVRRQAAMLRRSGLFDERWYLDRYRDVAESGKDPYLHYVEHGAKEGREPNAMLAAAKGEVMPKSAKI